MVSSQSKVSLNTLVERKTGLVFITKISDHTSTVTSNAVINRLSPLPHHIRKTLTTDNGFENTGYKELMEKLDISCFFAHPYHSWERGTNENTNGLIRWYFPKRTDFATISDEAIKAVEDALNNRPRKRLGWKTPLEAFNESVAVTG
jgi:IS30 family transposase